MTFKMTVNDIKTTAKWHQYDIKMTLTITVKRHQNDSRGFETTDSKLQPRTTSRILQYQNIAQLLENTNSQITLTVGCLWWKQDWPWTAVGSRLNTSNESQAFWSSRRYSVFVIRYSTILDSSVCRKARGQTMITYANFTPESIIYAC